MEPLISVIVPIYKVEQYLRQCVDSILNQTYTNLEVILVDDGSPDNCGAICDEYAAKDARVKVIHKKNEGVSVARNIGMEIAKGELWMFGDSDDWLEPSAIELLYELITKYDADIAVGGIQKEMDRTGEILFSNCGTEPSVHCFTKEEAMRKMMTSGWGPWARLYQRKVHENVLFPVGEFNEDEAIALKLFEGCKRIVEIDQLVYHYRSREDSITTSKFSEKHLDWYKHCKADVEWVQKHHPELIQVALNRLYTCIILHLQEIAPAGPRYWYLAKPLKKELKIRYSEISIWYHHTGMSKAKLLLLRYFPYFVYGCMAKAWWMICHR